MNTKTFDLKVYGIVQGVGFRPFVSRLAVAYGLTGNVCNKGPYVQIRVQGNTAALECFRRDLELKAPERSTILKIDLQEIENAPAYTRFEIIESARERGDIFVSPDIATCDKCAAELFDPDNRRYLHPFINCTACGPRLTILDSMPYDRERTSMKDFPMCPACAWEYTHAATRRFDAQPVCCNDCGPEVYLIKDFVCAKAMLAQDETRRLKNFAGNVAKSESTVPAYACKRGAEAITAARRIIKNGGIVAIKGIGGFHLCCDATSSKAVTRLRILKRRPFKPFAVMAKSLDVVLRECEAPVEARELLTGHQKPIVLLPRRNFYAEKIFSGISSEAFPASDSPRLANIVAPQNPRVGVMLPYAPIQMLLFDYPDCVVMPDLLVMTSGNPSGAPICRTDGDALESLGGMCDAILSHNRRIRLRADDTVTDFFEGRPYMIRRSRGFAPLPFMLSGTWRSVALAVGGELKNTFCVARGNLFYPSPYIGDLSDLRTVRALRESTDRMVSLLEAQPKIVACDLHPRYNSVAAAREIAHEHSLPLVQVQHHYAHILSCMAENDYASPVVGFSFDGTGYGPDGSVWGGEILFSDYHGYKRFASISPFEQSGGDLASHEGWRVTVNLLYALARSGRLSCLEECETCKDKTIHSTDKTYDAAKLVLNLSQRLTLAESKLVNAQLFLAGRRLNTVVSTSAGRLFDAVSALLGVRFVSTFEGEASMYLQFSAESWEQKLLSSKERAAVPSAGKTKFTDKLYRGAKRLAELSGLEFDQLAQLKRHQDGRILLPTDELFLFLCAARLSGANPNELAWLFHTVLALQCLVCAEALQKVTACATAALSGGVFQNTLLLSLLAPALRERGFKVLLHSQIPPNDGGIALGQAVYALANPDAASYC